MSRTRKRSGMRRSLAFKVLVSALFAFALLRIVRRRFTAEPPAPLYPDFVPEGIVPELFEVLTDDGLILRGKRYHNPDGPPCILFAGFSGNGFNYDIAFERSNFALYLARHGYDVWIANFRATGREPYKSDPGDYSHHVQDLSAYDVPAIVRAVIRRTDRKPFLFGHSMGGVACYGYLQGATYRPRARGRRTLTADPHLARERNDAVEGLVSLAGPASFRFPPGDRWHLLLGSPAARLVIRVLAAAAGKACARTGQVPIERAVTGLFRRSPGLAYRLLRLGYRFFMNLENTDREMLVESAISGMSDVSFREQYQLLHSLLTGDLIARSIDPADAGCAPHNLTANMRMITAPALFVAAEFDAVRPDVLFRDGYQAVSSEIKEFKRFDGYGHVDLIQGRDISDDVMPFIAGWLDRTVERGRGSVSKAGRAG